MDFKKALMNPVALLSPEKEIFGCLFPYEQSIWINLQSLDIFNVI